MDLSRTRGGSTQGNGAARAVTVQVMSEPWKTDTLPDLVGFKEACALLGVSKATLARWSQPGSGEHGPKRTYMIESKQISSGPVWDRQDVLGFARTAPRRR